MPSAKSDIRIMTVGTHHKCGTLWMRYVFKELAETLGLGFVRGNRRKHFRYLDPDASVIACSWNSLLPAGFVERPGVRILHLIRDPRDVLLSGARYHETFVGRNEGFLYHPRDELDGRSYQEHLQFLKTKEEKLLFEMSGKHAKTLNEMMNWDYDAETVMEIKYENLIVDFDAVLFGKALKFLGMTPSETKSGKEIFLRRSIFGKLKDDAKKNARLSDHIFSGAPRQWPKTLPKSVGRAYCEQYGEALIKLGYETDNSWVDGLSETPEMREGSV